MVMMILIACQKKEEKKESKEVEIPIRPILKFDDGTEIEFFENSLLKWKLRTTYLERWEEKDKVFAKPVHLQVYDSLGNEMALLKADSGMLDNSMNDFLVKGNVFVSSEEGTNIRADSLSWNKKENLVKTESRVRVISVNGDVLTGTGFQSDPKLKKWKILSKVTAIIQDAEEKYEQSK